MIEGEVENLYVTIHPYDADYNEIIWSSSDESVATVMNGEVTAISVGSAVITASAGQTSGTCNVTVKKRIIHVESIVPNIAQKRLKIGEEFGLELTILPDDANDYKVDYSSLNPDIASVSSEGTVIGRATGITVISIEADGQRCDIPIKVLEKDVVYAEADYRYYVGGIRTYDDATLLWKDNDLIVSEYDYYPWSFYFINNRLTTLLSSEKPRIYEHIYFMNDGVLTPFNLGDDSNRGFVECAVQNKDDVYSLVEWYYNEGVSKRGIWKNTEKMFDLGNEMGLSEYSRCGFGPLFFSGDELYICGSINEPIDETTRVTYPVVWKDGKLIRKFDIREADAERGGWILDMAEINGQFYYLMRRSNGSSSGKIAVYDDNGKLYDIRSEAASVTGEMHTYNDKLYVAVTTSLGDFSVFENGNLLYTLPNIKNSTIDIVDGDIYALVQQRRMWGGDTYHTLCVYRGDKFEYALTEESTNYYYPIKIMVFNEK